MTPKPNPGSKEAIKQGCICPVIDNEDVKGTALSWIHQKCPLHGFPLRKQKESLRKLIH